ncbi:hypothetical protein CN918_27955 [Priestia megaterium]|nr:hypothetical protein CN918_27955 [Priestia megaterium]
MRLIHFLLAAVSAFIGIVYILVDLNVNVQINVEPYYYLMAALGLASFIYIPYKLFQEAEEVIVMNGITIEKRLIHQLIKEELEDKSVFSLSNTIIQQRRRRLHIMPHITVLEVSTISMEESTKELKEVITKKMQHVFGDSYHYELSLIYLSK